MPVNGWIRKKSCLVYQYLFIGTVLSAPHLYNFKNAFGELPTQKKIAVINLSH